MGVFLTAANRLTCESTIAHHSLQFAGISTHFGSHLLYLNQPSPESSYRFRAENQVKMIIYKVGSVHSYTRQMEQLPHQFRIRDHWAPLLTFSPGHHHGRRDPIRHLQDHRGWRWVVGSRPQDDNKGRRKLWYMMPLDAVPKYS